MFKHTHTLICGSLASLLLSSFSFAQTQDTPIVDQTMQGLKKADEVIIESAKKLIEAKKLLSHDDVIKQLAAPKYAPLTLPEAKKDKLSTEEVAQLGRKSNLRVGYCFLCTKCDHWHLNLAGGYAIAADVVATCNHVVDTSNEIREGYLIVVDADDQVHAVNAVMAHSKVMDTALLRVEGANLTPLSLNDEVQQGATAYCYSSPLGQQDYFSDGIVNRFFWDRGYSGGDKNDFLVSRHLRVNFSTDWAPGSSGSAVLDQSGNVIGHVSVIAPMGEAKGKSAFITLHTGVPAYSVKQLVNAMANPESIKAVLDAEAKLPAEAKKPAPTKGKAAPAKKAA